MAKKKRFVDPDQPLLYTDHKLPVTRRDFLRAGFITSSATVIMPSILAMSMNKAYAALNTLEGEDCGILGAAGGGMVPFICFDLGGGANMAGSNVLVGGQGGQDALLSTAGYNKLGLPGDMTPADPTFIDTSLGLLFHSDSAFLRGIHSKTTADCRLGINGCVIPARSDNDTGNNPHNPMYGIAKAGAAGRLVTLAGTQNSDSGGRSMAPASMIDLTNRPTKVANANEARGLVDTGSLGSLMPDQAEAGMVMRVSEQISRYKIDSTAPDGVTPTSDAIPATQLEGKPPTATNTNGTTLQELAHCGYLKTTDTVENFGSPDTVDPTLDGHILASANQLDRSADVAGGNILPEPTTQSPPLPGNTNQLDLDVASANLQAGQSIFNDNDIGRFQSASAIMKLVIGGYAGAGTISMGGYDYHNGTRATGEIRDFRAGQAMGACLEYAHRMKQPLMLYVFTDGSLASNGRTEGGDGRGKGEWTGDNSGTSAAFFLVYKPGGTRPQLLQENGIPVAQRQQLGHFRASASVETDRTTPGANAVNLLAEMVVLNYMSLHSARHFGGLEAHEKFVELFPNTGLGDVNALRRWIAFNPVKV